MSKSNGYKTAAHIQDRIMQKMMAENERQLSYIERGEQVMELRTMGCCGMKEVKGIIRKSATPMKIIKYICEASSYCAYAKGRADLRSQAGMSAYVLSMAIATKKSGWNGGPGEHRITRAAAEAKIKALREYIRKYKLGRLTVCTENPNPSHNRESIVIPMVFTPDHDRLMDFCVKKGWAHDLSVWMI